jgi:putative ubiquitin-RnfH superfamily antitoxin RatB of RatAB toxin-antitoxin module
MAPLRVEVVYALPEGEDAVTVSLAPGATLLDAIAASGLAARHPEIDLARHRIGVYGQVKAAACAAADGDRIEIYRALLVEAKEARRRRAAKKPAKRRA